MTTRITVAAIAIATTLAWQAAAQNYDTNNVVVQTFAGSGFSGHLDGQGTQTMFSGPQSIAADTLGNLFVYEQGNQLIRKITPAGEVSTFAGGGTGNAPGFGTNVSLGYCLHGAMTIDHSNTLYLLDQCSGRVMWRVESGGYISTVALNELSAANGAEKRNGLCVDSMDNVYISDSVGNRIFRYRTNGVLEVFAGSGNLGFEDGNGVFTSFAYPSAIAADSADNIYVSNGDSPTFIRKINQDRDVTTIAGRMGFGTSKDGLGTNATFYTCVGMCSDSLGNVYLGEPSSIRRISATTNVTTVAGSFIQTGYVNGSGAVARFNFSGFGASANALCFSQGGIYIADYSNSRIRKIVFNPSTRQVDPANLNLELSPRLRITGTVGRTYRIESSTDLNGWRTEVTVLLTSSPYLWIDPSSAGKKKFYRAFLLP